MYVGITNLNILNVKNMVFLHVNTLDLNKNKFQVHK